MPNVVEQQYKKWMYPLPVDDMQEAIVKHNYREFQDPGANWPAYWPHKRLFPKNCNMLVAGCGTNQAAYHAVRFPEATITAVDLSETSLAHEAMLKEKHNLTNLTLHKMDLTRIAELGQKYDYIVSTGVLHHLPDPLEGFKALKTVLKPEGVFCCMVYGSSLRLGVYLMQELFRLCGLQQTEEDLAIVKDTIAHLPKDHVVQRYANVANDLRYDAGMVDTFLHRQDRSFYIPELFALFRKAGLEFLTWNDNGDYSLEASVPASHPLWPKLRTLTREQQYHAHDLLTQAHGVHRFVLAHPEYVKRCRIPFDSEALLDCSALFKIGVEVKKKADMQANTLAQLTRGETRQFQMSAVMGLLMDRMERGGKTLRQAMESVPLTMESLPEVAEGLQKLYNMGHIFVLLPEDGR